jgi:hypothetical protein
VSVVLLRLSDQTDPFTATWENVTHEVVDDNGLPLRIAGRDFVLPKSALVIGGSPIEPRSGDQLSLTENGVAQVYELVPVGNLPAAELLPGGFRYRVHTKRVS